MAIIVRWRWASDNSDKVRVEDFPSVAAAKQWIRNGAQYKKRHPDEDFRIVIDTSFDRESNPAHPKVHKGIYYFPTFRSAREFATKKEYPTDRILHYERGWAIQGGKSGDYAGPHGLKVGDWSRESNPAGFGPRKSNPASFDNLKLWRYDPITGYWRVAQGPFESAEVAAQYLAIFQKDEPGIVFKLSARRPPYPESSRKRNPGRSSLERESSWVIVNRKTGEPILETFQKSVADKVNAKKYEVVPILQWLRRVNRKAREK